ncbi:MAG: DEAD/DEAH box helicase family protein [Eubacteriales bacterium]
MDKEHIFDRVHFHGTFRDYQKRVLDNADSYLKDGKINIVAAPGSGKTVLGLELIRKIGKPCLILSPTTAIRNQWGERFRELFLDDRNDFADLYSDDLHEIHPVNSVTYQALYAAMGRIPSTEEGDADFTDFDLLSAVREYGIQTVCLDEAHHLKNEWQKALETFLSHLDGNVKIVSLTATPPYDSDGTEWNRYVRICGEIDEEIFVPELVSQNSLCPHQDYVYFNYPTKAEASVLSDYRKNALMAVEEIGESDFLPALCRKMNGEKEYEKLFSSVKENIALLTLFHHYGFPVSKKLIRVLTTGNGLPFFGIGYAQTAIRYLLESDWISDENKDEMICILKKYGVYEMRKVSLELSEKLKRTLVSSAGKLESIRQIALSEYAAMGPSLRMLILTDYIKKENVDRIATDERFQSVNVVSIFVTLRREESIPNIGVLSGSLVILPESLDLSAIDHKKRTIPGTDYCTVEFSGNNSTQVAFVSRLFEEGKLQVLVGTKSLLGEGWDSPCINSLILASFVGSYVLSNQMRGRAIRTDRANPDKCANIWHPVTVEPEYLFKDTPVERLVQWASRDLDQLTSWDFEVLKRRFDSFMGPNYTTGEIESGIERLTVIAPPFDQKGIERINAEMLKRSAQRSDVAENWNIGVSGGRFEVAVEGEIPKEKRIPVFTFYNVALTVILLSNLTVILSAFFRSAVRMNFPTNVILAAVGLALTVPLTCLVKRIVLHFNPARSIKTLGIAVYQTLRECGMIADSARVEVRQNQDLDTVSLYLRGASVHDQNIFNTAMREMLSPIENPRYILIRKKLFHRYDYNESFACPSCIGRKKESVALLAEKLKKTTGNFIPVCAHREDGRKLILKCRRKSYITYNQRMIDKKYKVSRWE